MSAGADAGAGGEPDASGAGGCGELKDLTTDGHGCLNNKVTKAQRGGGFNHKERRERREEKCWRV